MTEQDQKDKKAQAKTKGRNYNTKSQAHGDHGFGVHTWRWITWKTGKGIKPASWHWHMLEQSRHR